MNTFNTLTPADKVHYVNQIIKDEESFRQSCIDIKDEESFRNLLNIIKLLYNHQQSNSLFRSSKSFAQFHDFVIQKTISEYQDILSYEKSSKQKYEVIANI